MSEEDKGYSYEKLKEDLKQFEVNYKDKSKGPAKEKVYADFMEFVRSEAKAFEKLENFKEEEFEEQQRTAEICTKLESMQQDQMRMEALMVEEMEENRRQAEKLTQEYAEKMEKMKEEER